MVSREQGAYQKRGTGPLVRRSAGQRRHRAAEHDRFSHHMWASAYAACSMTEREPVPTLSFLTSWPAGQLTSPWLPLPGTPLANSPSKMCV